jgi:hypothetical protein
MKFLSTCLLAATLFGGIVLTGCEVEHEHETKHTWTGGTKTEDTRTTENPVTGDTHTTHTETKTP